MRKWPEMPSEQGVKLSEYPTDGSFGNKHAEMIP